MKNLAKLSLSVLLAYNFYETNGSIQTEILISPTYKSVKSGKVIYEINCSNCHGLNGTDGKFGAKNLQKSTLSDEQYQRIIQKGKGIMPSWEKKFTVNEISDVIGYIKTLKKE